MGSTYSKSSTAADVKLTPADDLIARIESKEENLASVDLRHISDITPRQLSHLFHAITKNKKITSLNMTGISINEATARELAVLPISTLIAQNCNFNDNVIILLSQNKFITTLNISCNNFGERGAAALANNNCLKELIARSNHLGHASKHLFSALQFLILADLSLNQITDEDLDMMQCPNTLEKLTLSGNNITELGAIALLTHHHLRELDLNNNEITSKEKIEKTITGTTVYMWHNDGINCQVPSPPSKPATARR